ncbi:MAG: flavoprotein [Spirochaetia bacterium]|nr:flavoprotein [Spirochaetia bacterium]
MLKETNAENGSRHILLCLSGSISAYKAASLASALVKDGHEVQCAATESALQFIGPAALEGITRKPLKKELFAESSEIEHIELARWADLILLYPASAATIARLRAGLAEDLVSAIFLANNFQSPYWIAPAMNSRMLEHPATQENINILMKWGARIIETETGTLACGETGTGRLVEPETIHAMIKELFG